MTAYIGGNKIKDTGSYGVYLGSPNTNCLTYTPKNINLELNNGTLTLKAGSKVYVPNGFDAVRYYKYTYEAWTQPVLSANGTLGGNSFAVASDDNTTYPAWKAFNKDTAYANNNACISKNVSSGFLSWYNPTPIKITNVQVMNYVANRTVKGYKLQGSNDNSVWVDLASGTNTVTTQQGIWNISIANNKKAYKYHRIYVTSATGSEWGICTLTITAQQQTGSVESTADDYDYTVGDGSMKFDEVVIANDLSTRYTYAPSTNSPCVLFVNKSGTGFTSFRLLTACVSGTTRPSGNYINWYDTNNNIIESISADNTTHETGLSLPFAIITQGSDGNTISIDQTFDWCGYIGGTAFVLPGVKGLISNGFNADGTYKSIEFETDRVLIDTATSGEFNRPVKYFLFDNGLNSWGSSNNNVVYLDTRPSVAPATYCTAYIKDENRWIRCTSTTTWTEELNYFEVAESVTASSGTITSLTPYTAQPLTTVIPFNAIYHGSDLVYQYDSYDPEHIFVNSVGEKTLTVTLKKGVYYVDITGGGAAMRYGYYYACFMNGGGSGASCYGEFYNPKEQTFTLYAGGGGSSAVKGVDSYMNIGSTRIITAGGGNQCHANGSCSGNTGGTGTLDFSSGLIENISVTAHTGNKGSYTSSGAPAAAASVSPHGFGAGGTGSACAEGKNTAGGIYLKYVRASK